MPRIFVAVSLLGVAARPAIACAQEPATLRAPASNALAAFAALPDEPSPSPQVVGSVSVLVMDGTGAAIRIATATLTWAVPPRAQSVQTDAEGQLTFSKITAGPFRLAISAPGFAPVEISGTLSAGQVLTLASITMAVASATTDVEVNLTRTEIAQVQLDAEEKQRLIGVFPNFYVTYSPNPVPLDAKQKFTLAGHFILDPVSFGITAVTAGIQQANNTYPGFGQGASGYAKRYAASTGTLLDGVLIGNAILPVILKQDPRYFYKGTGTVNSRIWYAIANAVICKGDNGHWQANYSAIGGGLAAGAISNFYYPAKNRDGLGLTFQNLGIGTAEGAAGNLVQEFFFRKITPHAGKNPSKGESQNAVKATSQATTSAQ